MISEFIAKLRAAANWECLTVEQTLLLQAADVIEELSEKLLHDGWIPFDKRQPDKNGWYITTYDGDICGEDGKRYVGMSEWEDDGWIEDTVYAWMPLPEPYREGEK